LQELLDAGITPVHLVRLTREQEIELFLRKLSDAQSVETKRPPTEADLLV